ncbi:MAG: hypothetical protein HYU66_01050 [Armatimonadetes bacterium]|nr:hypothetical protein [Armatimonadota bacterium]
MRRLPPALLLAVLALLVFSRGVAGQRYGDDLGFIADQPAWAVYGYFAHANPNHGWYRPLEATGYALVQLGFGLATVPLHLMLLALHVVLAWRVFRFTDALAGRAAAWWAAAWFTVVQTNAIAVGSCDTFSQVAGTLCGWLAMEALYRARSDDRRAAWAGVAWFAVALLCKETSAGFLPAGLLLLAWPAQCPSGRPPLPPGEGWGEGVEGECCSSGDPPSEPDGHPPPHACADPHPSPLPGGEGAGTGRRARTALALLAVFAAYYLVRSRVIPYRPGFGDEGYDFHFGLNLLRNPLLLGGAAASPCSTASLARMAHEGDRAGLAPAASGALVLLTLVAAGCRQTRRARLAAALLLLALTALSPVLLLNHVSELYIYNALPAAVVVVGMGLAGATAGRRWAVAVSLALLLAHAAGTVSKLGLMVDNGARATALLAELEGPARQVPPGGRLLLVELAQGEPKYSVYLLPGAEVLRHGLMRLPQMVGRHDFEARLTDAGDPILHPPRAGDVVVRLAHGRPITGAPGP